MFAEVTLETILVKVRFQTEYFLCYLLILAFNSLKLLLSLIKVQALCFELNGGHGLTFDEVSAPW